MHVKRQLKSAYEHGLKNQDLFHTDSQRILTHQDEAKECWEFREHFSKIFTPSDWSEDHSNKKVWQYSAL
jgi:hypothetical protein